MWGLFVLFYCRFNQRCGSTGFTGGILLAVETDGPAYMGKPPSPNILFDKYNVTWHFLYKWQWSDTPWKLHPHKYMKYDLMTKWCKQLPPKTAVVFADVRDTYFQSNPVLPMATMAYEADLHLYKEHRKNTIGSDKTNGNWIKDCFGEEFFTTVKNNAIICSGAMIGTAFGMGNLGAKVLTEINSRLDDQKCRDFDQRYVMFLFYKGRLQREDGAYPAMGVKLWDMMAPQAAVAHLGLCPKAVIKYDDKHRILNQDSGLVPIVHQYDRKQVDKTYPRRWCVGMLARMDYCKK